jgi:transcriptional regulator GlxA family with amidase domain
VDALRVEAARRALEENDDRINEIAESCGFTDEERMRNAFCAAAAASTLASKAAVKKTAALRRFPSIF